MPILIPVPQKSTGDVLTATNWNEHIANNVNKLLSRGHRVLTVAQFSALTGLEDGDEVYLEVDAANGIMWHLRYVAAEPTYKWRFLGGPSMLARVETEQDSSSAGLYADLATDGPSITLPRGGDYEWRWGANVGDQDAGFADAAVGLFVNAVLAFEARGFSGGSPGGAAFSTARTTAAAASQVAKLRYKTSAGTDRFGRRVIACTPVRLRHDG